MKVEDDETRDLSAFSSSSCAAVKLTQEAATPVFNSFIPENRSRKGQNSHHANQRLKDETKRGIREKALFIRREGCYCK
jgi:hypothetical protein